MGRGLFITGTDTGVGKTLVTAMILVGLQEAGLRVAAMKPVTTCTTVAAAKWARMRE